MRVTILPYAIVLVSRMGKGCIVACVLPLRCFLFLLPNYTNILVYFFYFHYLVMSLKYSFLNTPR